MALADAPGLPVEHVDMGMPAAFVWDYDARRPRLSKLYEKSKVSQWNAATDVDWSVEIDPGANRGNDPRWAELEVGQPSDDPATRFMLASEENFRLMAAHDHAWLVSQFMHGEQGALVATAKICAGADSIDDKYYAAAQVADEARHVEAYQRYLDKTGLAYPISPSLHELLDDVMGHRHLDMTFLGMQILIEGVALAAFSLGEALFSNPVISTITELVRRDEARHVAFGVLSLQGRYEDMDPVDLREREDFLLEACALMRDRFMPVQVWEEFDLDVDACTQAFLTAPETAAFRSLMFSKVVPNLRKLGLLTPRVRDGFEQLGILRFERFVDSATEAGELEPDPADADASAVLAQLRASLGDVERIAPEPVLTVIAGMADRARLADVPPSRIRLEVTGIDDGDWHIVVGDGEVTFAPSGPGDEPEVTVTMDEATWADLVTGRSTAAAAAIEGRVALAGDLLKALVLEELL